MFAYSLHCVIFFQQIICNSVTNTFTIEFDSSKRKDSVIVCVGSQKVLYKIIRQPAGHYSAQMQFERLDNVIEEICALKNGLQNTGLCVDRTNSMLALARLWEDKYRYDSLICLMHILQSILQRARVSFVDLLELVNLLMAALNGTKLGDVYKTLKLEEYIRERNGRNNSNNTNEANTEEKEEIKYKPGIHKGSTTRTFTAESIQCCWLSKNRRIIEDLVQSVAAQPYLTDELRNNIIGSPQFWLDLNRYRLGYRLLHMCVKKWQGSVCTICLCLFVCVCLCLFV